ncbi:MAG: helix-turn-helix domain-containing protein [Cenarchaeum sp. SB0673_bin_9]|nr:helix-turn-helix domain-containing protein [Cenarchaeum sp. SB0673_bin_9]
MKDTGEKKIPMFSGVYNLQKGKNVAEAAAELCMSRRWDLKWYKHYQKEDVAGLEDRSRSGRAHTTKLQKDK